MGTKNIIEGLQILMPYYDRPDGYNLGAEHDTIYAYATDEQLSTQDVKKMIELGWEQERDDYDIDWTSDDYASDVGWFKYV